MLHAPYNQGLFLICIILRSSEGKYIGQDKLPLRVRCSRRLRIGSQEGESHLCQFLHENNTISQICQSIRAYNDRKADPNLLLARLRTQRPLAQHSRQSLPPKLLSNAREHTLLTKLVSQPLVFTYTLSLLVDIQQNGRIHSRIAR